MAGAVFSMGLIVNLIDFMFALMAIPTMLLLLVPDVVEATRRYWAARDGAGGERP